MCCGGGGAGRVEPGLGPVALVFHGGARAVALAFPVVELVQRGKVKSSTLVFQSCAPCDERHVRPQISEIRPAGR